MNYKKNILAAALLITPMALWAQPGGGPPAGVGGGVGGGLGGTVGGLGHGAGGLGGSVSGNGNANAAGSIGDLGGMSRAEAHRADLAAKKAAAKAKADAAGANGAAHANENAAFGQETAAQARTLKDADPATRAAFGDSVSARAKDQGKGGDDTATEPTEPTEATEVEADSSTSTAVSANAGSNGANAKADFGQSTATSAKTLKDADPETRQAFGTTVQTAAKAKTKPTATPKQR